MATSTQIRLDTAQKPEFYTEKLNDKAAAKASELLQENHEKHHIFFNKSRFHNHIAHHLLTIYALGATPDAITKGYEGNANYQRAHPKLEAETVQHLHDPATYAKCLGDQNHYFDFMTFYASEIDKNGLEATLDKFVFADTTVAFALFGRLFAGLLHPIIHLGFGLEFNQPAIVAEALAETAVHENWLSPILIKAEEEAKKYDGPEKTLHEILEETRKPEITSVVTWEDDNKSRDGIMKRGMDIVPKLVGRWKVREDQLEQKTAEMLSNVLYYSAASQNPKKQIKFDFLNIHHTNSAIFFPNFLEHPAIKPATRIRLLEWKGRFDIINYIGRNAPALYPQDITNYVPKQPGTGWPDIFERATEYDDDGHTSKLVRVIALGEEFCKKYEGQKGFVVSGDMWLKMGHMAIDSVDNGPNHWVRNCGWEEAWKDIPAREEGKL